MLGVLWKVKISPSRSLFHSFCLVFLRRLHTTPPRWWKLIKVYLIIMFMSSRSFVIKSFTTFTHSVSGCVSLGFMIEYDEVSNLILCLFCFCIVLVVLDNWCKKIRLSLKRIVNFFHAITTAKFNVECFKHLNSYQKNKCVTVCKISAFVWKFLNISHSDEKFSAVA